MNYLQFIQKLKKKQIPPVSLVYGTEPYFIQNIKDLFIQMTIKEEGNLAAYDLREASIQEVVEDAETYPFFGGQKLIFASNPVFLQAKPDKLLTDEFEHDLSVLERYLNNPAEYSILVLIAPYDSIDKRKKLTKSLSKNGVIVECNPIKSYEQGKWINELAKSLNITIEENAYELFEAFSTDLQQLESELHKMSLYVGENGIITREIAEQLISQTSNSSSLQLADAVIQRNLAKAMSIYKDLEKMNEEPIALIGLLAYQFRNMLRVKLLKSTGYNLSQIQRQIGGHPYPIKIAYNREKQFTTRRLEQIMDSLAQTDATIKQGKMEKGLAVELLLYELIRS